jgi:hypothetical protein
MKNITLILITIALSFVGNLNAEVLEDFTAVSRDNGAVLEWKSTIEQGAVEYRIQRSFDGQTFHTVNRVMPKGNSSSYRYVDEDLFKERINTYYYRIEVALAGGQIEMSQIAEVTISFSSVHRTWGSLKAMFR